MSELRERFRALDALDVPDVMSRARMIGPKAPEPHPAPRMRRIGALVFAAIVAIAAVVLVIRALDQPPQPADPTPTPPAFRQDGEVITYSDPEPREAADLVATDPQDGSGAHDRRCQGATRALRPQWALSRDHRLRGLVRRRRMGRVRDPGGMYRRHDR